MWTKKDKRPQKSEWHRVPLQRPYLCCSSWWDLVRRCPYILKKQLSWNLVKSTLFVCQSSFMENHALMPRAYKPCKPVARKGTQNLQCNRCNVFLVFITSAGIMKTAQMFSYIIQLFCFSCKIEFKWRLVIGSFKCTVVNRVQLERKMEGGSLTFPALSSHGCICFFSRKWPTHSVCKSQCLLQFSYRRNRQQYCAAVELKLEKFYENLCFGVA